MNISAKRLIIAVSTLLLCIVATLFWPGSNRQKQKDNTIGAAVLLPAVKKDTLQAPIRPPAPKPQAPAAEAPKLTIVPTDDGAFTLQVSSWRSRWKAELDMKRFQEQGFEAYIQRVYIPEKGGVWHRVRIGRFASRELAAQQADAVQDMLQTGFWIATR